jgi:hypothetical protein
LLIDSSQDGLAEAENAATVAVTVCGVADPRIDWTDGDPVEECAALWARWRGEMDAYVMRAFNPSSAPSYGVPGDL